GNYHRRGAPGPGRVGDAGAPGEPLPAASDDPKWPLVPGQRRLSALLGGVGRGCGAGAIGRTRPLVVVQFPMPQVATGRHTSLRSGDDRRRKPKAGYALRIAHYASNSIVHRPSSIVHTHAAIVGRDTRN